MTPVPKAVSQKFCGYTTAEIQRIDTKFCDALLHNHRHTQSFLSGCEEVENRISQLVEPRNLPQPRNYPNFTPRPHKYENTRTHNA